MALTATRAASLIALDSLFDQASIACKKAYAPYSRFHVGAAILSGTSGKIYSGCNVENVSYPLGTCAEANAIAAARVAEGAEFRAVAIAVYAAKKGVEHTPCSPCGACRQRIIELGQNVSVRFFGAGLTPFDLPVSDLLPHAFSIDPIP